MANNQPFRCLQFVVVLAIAALLAPTRQTFGQGPVSKEVHLIVRVGTSISNLEDLRNRRLCLGPAGMRAHSKKVLQAAGLQRNGRLQVVIPAACATLTDFNQFADLLVNGKPSIDAFFYVAKTPIQGLNQLVAARKVEIHNFDPPPDVIAKMNRQYSGRRLTSDEYEALSKSVLVPSYKPYEPTFVGRGASLSPDDQEFLRGIEIAVEERYARGSMLDGEVGLTIWNEKEFLDDPISLARRVASEPTIGIIGHFNDRSFAAAQAVYEQSRLLHISFGLSASIFPTRHSIRLSPTAESLGISAARFMKRGLPTQPKRVGIIADSSPLSRGIVESFRAAAEPDVQIISVISKPDLPAVDALARAGVQAIFLASFRPDLASFFGTAARKERIPIVMVASQLVDAVKALAFAGAEGSYVVGSTVKRDADLTQTLFAKHGALSDLVLYGYTAARILFAAIDNTRSTDGFELARFIRSRTWNSPLGLISFDDAGNLANAPLTVWSIEKGKIIDLRFRQ